MMLKKTVLIFGIIIVFICLYQIYGNIKVDCVYNELHNDSVDKDLKKLIKDDLHKTISKWNREGRIGFSTISESDTLSPIIINNKKNKILIFYISFFDKYTAAKQIKGIFRNGTWEFTINGTQNFMLSKYETNEKSYQESLKKILSLYQGYGYINTSDCNFNDKLFENFNFFEMGNFGIYD